MPRETLVLQVFVASPSDVTEERAGLEAIVAQLNQVWSNSLGVMFELVKWETTVHPSFSSDPQAVINEQIGSDYDVFIGIFWGRIGTPTPRAKSGAIEEFERAYARLKRTNTGPEMMLYFKDAPIAPSKIDVNQLQALQEFRASLSDRGGLYSMFEDQAGFESSLRAHLAAVAQKFASQRHSGQAVIATTPRETSLIPDGDDLGYLDYVEIFDGRMAEAEVALSAINEATHRLTQQLGHRTDEMHAAGRSDARTARRYMKRAADDMTSYSDTLDRQIAILSASRTAAFDALTNALAIRTDIAPGDSELQALRGSLATLIDNTADARTGMRGMRESAGNLPRMTKEINVAKRHVVAQLDAFLAEIDSISSTVANVVEAIDRMLGAPSKNVT